MFSIPGILACLLHGKVASQKGGRKSFYEAHLSLLGWAGRIFPCISSVLYVRACVGVCVVGAIVCL